MAKKRVEYITSTPKRSLIKATTWEIISFLITLAAVYIIYGDIEKSLKFSIVLTLIKIFFLYLHERIWKKTMWEKAPCKK